MDFSDYTKKDIKEHFHDTYYENKVEAEIGQELERHYPGWQWWVECTLKAGVVAVKNLDLHGDYGFIIHLNRYLTNPERLKMVMRAGGETLERYNQDRAKAPEKIEVERDIRGNAIGEH